MTEIINDVGVSGCRFLDEYEHCDICKELCEGHCLILQDIECKTYEDCHYRQLKRLEAETAKLKEKLEKILDLCKTLEDVGEEYIRIQLIKEIIEDKKDIHYYLEQDEVTKDEY